MSEEKKEDIRSVIGQAIGEASMCWSETPKGVFESNRASELVDEILAAFHLEAGMGVTRWTEVMAENKRLREALEFYSGNNDWGLDWDLYSTREANHADRGEVARKALGETEGE